AFDIKETTAGQFIGIRRERGSDVGSRAVTPAAATVQAPSKCSLVTTAYHFPSGPATNGAARPTAMDPIEQIIRRTVKEIKEVVRAGELADPRQMNGNRHHEERIRSTV
ncbi:hypothetical protein PFISCL1PPCAC_27820, partial [Pristionchus fissidentatus]